MSACGRVPEDRERVAAFDARLRKRKSEVVDAAARHCERYAARKITTLKGIGWPLRPLFIRRPVLDFIASALVRSFDALRRALLDLVPDLDALARAVPIDRRVLEGLDLASTLADADLVASILRPDGFHYEDRFVLSEVNFGNGTIVSNAYSEVMYDFFAGAGSAVLRDLGLDAARGIPRPFRALIDLLRARLPPGRPIKGGHPPRTPRAAPFVALLAHRFEHEVILGWPERVIQQLYFAQAMLREAGLENRVVFEDENAVDAGGVASIRADGQEVDLVIRITIGTSFMDEPERLRGDLAAIAGLRAGRAPIVKPLASLLFDKGTMPFLGQLDVGPLADAETGLRFELAATEFPESEKAVVYRTDRADWVLKRAFDGKDTQIGATTHGRLWNRTLHAALATKDYVIQRYQSLPTTVMPVCVDGKNVEWIPVRVEISPFIIEGRYAGAIARYAPDREGLILSPPPEDMGMTTIFAV